MSALVIAFFTVATAFDRPASERLYTQAEAEERDLSFAAALEHYEASVDAAPSNRWALRATARARWLRARSEGGFEPLVRLERIRRDANAQRDGATVDALAHDLESFPPGEVRVEARMYVAEAYAARLGRTGDAERELDKLLDETGGDPPLRAQAATRLADIAMDQGDADVAKRAVARAGNDTQLASRVARWIRRRWLTRFSIATLGLFALLAGAAGVRSLRAAARVSELRRFAPKAALICVYLALVATALAGQYENGHALPFLLMPACMLPIVLAARAWGLAGAPTRGARALRAALSALAVVAAAFLVLQRIDVRYLEGFGL